MANGAEVTFVGNMTRDPELKYGGTSGKAWCTFAIAVNKVFKNQAGEKTEKVVFFNCKAFSDVAENIASSLSKGVRVFVTGSLEQEEWEDSKGGGKRTAMVIIVDDAGPSLRWATAQVTRTANTGGSRASAPAEPSGTAEPYPFSEGPLPF